MWKWLKCNFFFGAHNWGEREEFFPPQQPSERHGWVHGYRHICKRCGDVKFVE